jgi:hypothetical protein
MGISASRPRLVDRAMNSWQIKLGSFSENSNAATLALSIKVSERVDTESAEGAAAGGASGQGGGAVCLPRFRMGGASEQGGDCDCVGGDGAEGVDCAGCAGCDSGEDARARKSARITSRQMKLPKTVVPAAILVLGLVLRAYGR